MQQEFRARQSEGGQSPSESSAHSELSLKPGETISLKIGKARDPPPPPPPASFRSLSYLETTHSVYHSGVLTSRSMSFLMRSIVKICKLGTVNRFNHFQEGG